METDQKAPERIRGLLEAIIKELVDRPDKVEVNQVVSQGGNTWVLTIKTANGEAGKVIGKQGRNVQALRLLLESMAAKHRRRIVLEVADNRRKLQRSNAHDKLESH